MRMVIQASVVKRRITALHAEKRATLHGDTRGIDRALRELAAIYNTCAFDADAEGGHDVQDR